METTQQHHATITCGTLIATAGGCVIADTPSATAGSMDGTVKPEPFWYDTDGGRHFPNPTDGTLTVVVPTFRTRDYGRDRNGVGHVLLNSVPSQLPRGLCEESRDMGSNLSVWSAGAALMAVNCRECRRMAGLVNTKIVKA